MTVWITRADGVAPAGAVRLAVKDNIDVAGMPTTCAHPAYAYTPAVSAPCVSRLVDAGMVVVGKTNLDQFATGLVGTRSPYGVVENPIVAGRISGGSSSGSAVAVATGEADIALGSDTAGSGRVPAALCGIVGLKPTRVLVSGTGMVPACYSLDCVSLFARTVGEAVNAANLIAGFDPTDPISQPAPLGTPVVPVGPFRIGIPRDVDLDALDEAALNAWNIAVKDLARLGTVTTIDITPYFGAGDTVYDSFVAERWDAFGPFLASHPDGADPTVTAIVERAGQLPAHALAAAQLKLVSHRNEVANWWHDVDVVVMPTVGEAPTVDEVAADPFGVNARLGRYTLGCNPLDLCAIAVPAGVRADDVPFGITFFGPAFADPVVASAAARFLDEPEPPVPDWVGWTTVFVVGAHLTGQPLNHTLASRGGHLVAATETAAEYRMYALDTTPPKPGLVRDFASGEAAAIAGELWRLPLDQLGPFVDEIPAPLGIGTVTLADGSEHNGFICEPFATDGATEITSFGGWRAYLDR